MSALSTAARSARYRERKANAARQREIDAALKERARIAVAEFRRTMTRPVTG